MPNLLLRTLPVVLVACLLLLGCDDNVFSGLNSEGTSDDPEVLLADARAALAKGDTAQALTYLERAHEIAPENAEVRVELVGTRFEMNNVDLLAIREIGEYIVDGAKAVRASASEPNYICSFDEDPSTYPAFDYAEAPAYQRLAGLADLFEDAITLLGDVDVVEADLPDDLKARLLLMRAFTRAFQTIVAIDGEVKALGIDLFRLPDGEIGICADANQFDSISDAQQLVEDVERIIECTLLPGYEEALTDLRTRNDILGGDPDNLLLDVMSDALDAMRQGIDGDCSAG